MARITEQELILPALFVINEKNNKGITTSEIIKELELLLEIDTEDREIIKGRNDSYFTQKVRNLKSHNTLVKNDLATYTKGIFKITSKGEEYLAKNQEKLKLIIAEEKFLHQYSRIITEYFNEFNNSIKNIRDLTEVCLANTNLQSHYYNMLYSSVITSLETYLADALKYNLSKNEEFLINFVKTFKDFKNIKCDFNDIFNLCGTINARVEESLMSLLYHNLPKMKGIYKSTFNITFQSIDELIKSISIRHDLVHRNGKCNNGSAHQISKIDIINLCDKTATFIENIEVQIDSLTVLEDE